MKIVIYGRINIEGQWWDVALEGEEAAATPRAVGQSIQGKIKKLKTAGIISTVGGPPSAPTGGKSRPGYSEPMPQGTAIPPACPTHKAGMKLSTHQGKEGKQMWYCPKKDDAGYCINRAAIILATGKHEFFKTGKGEK